MAVLRSYIALATFTEERTKHVSLNLASHTLGYLVGPAVQAVFAKLGCSPRARSGETYLALDAYTMCGWAVAVSGAACCLLFLPCVFEEHNVAVVEKLVHSKGDPNAATKPDVFPLVVILISMFVLGFNFVFLTV